MEGADAQRLIFFFASNAQFFLFILHSGFICNSLLNLGRGVLASFWSGPCIRRFRLVECVEFRWRSDANEDVPKMRLPSRVQVARIPRGRVVTLLRALVSIQRWKLDSVSCLREEPKQCWSRTPYDCSLTPFGLFTSTPKYLNHAVGFKLIHSSSWSCLSCFACSKSDLQILNNATLWKMIRCLGRRYFKIPF